jgi:hypothetical protein
MIIFLLSYINYVIFSIIIIQDPKYDPKSAIIVNMDLHLDSQKFIEYESVYGSYNFLMNSHLNPLRSDSNLIH